MKFFISISINALELICVTFEAPPCMVTKRAFSVILCVLKHHHFVWLVGVVLDYDGHF